MNETILLEKYKLIWKEINEKVFMAEIRFYNKNDFGGTLETPIGILVGFKEIRPEFWRVKIIIRNNITYNQSKNKIYVIFKPAYKRKIKFYFDKFIDFVMPNYKIEDNFKNEIKNYLFNNNICREPMSISISEELNKMSDFYGEVTIDDLD